MYQQDTGVLSDRWLFTTPKVLRRREIIEMAPKRRRSERGPISLAVRALLELPDTIVAEILRLVDTGRFLKYNPHGTSFFIQQKGWSGTNRMSNRSKIMRRYNVWWDNLILGRWSGESYGEGIWIHDR